MASTAMAGTIWLWNEAGGGDTFVAVDAGQVTWTGQSIPATVAVAITAGTLTWTGQSVPGQVSLTVAVDPGQVTWAGQTTTASIDAAVSPGSILWTGQDVTTPAGPPAVMVRVGPDRRAGN